MEPNEKKERWLDQATGGIRFSPDRAEVRSELAGHLEDKEADLRRIFPNLTQEEAGDRALGEMGDPSEIGKELARLHRPWLGYLWIASKVLAVVTCLWLVSFLFLMGDDAYLGDDPYVEWWDFDGLPRNTEVYTGMSGWMCYEGDGDEPGRLMSAQPGLTEKVEGQNVSLLRTALWQREGQLELHCYLRVDSWRFWERGVLRGDWLRVTDSQGNVYPLGVDSPEDPESGAVWNYLDFTAGYGPFHIGYELVLKNLDPEAEWVRLDYGPVETIFSFVVELEEGST